SIGPGQGTSTQSNTDDTERPALAPAVQEDKDRRAKRAKFNSLRPPWRSAPSVFNLRAPVSHRTIDASMCGRFTNQYSSAELHALSGLSEASFPPSTFRPRYNVAPTDDLPVIRLKDGKREASILKWGFVPSSSKDTKDAAKLINARCETVADKPLYRSAFRHR